jgi:hypothetical protein
MNSDQAGKSAKQRGSADENAGSRQNEGEGNRTAARRYDRKATEFAQSGRVKGQAEAAKGARDGAERKDLDDAEKAGRSHAKGEDPEVKR